MKVQGAGVVREDWGCRVLVEWGQRGRYGRFGGLLRVMVWWCMGDRGLGWRGRFVMALLWTN